MINLLSEVEKKINNSVRDTGGSLSESLISENDDNHESGHETILNEDVECPSCNVHFASNSSYQKHLPCKPE
jgi:hypothetical protein